MLIAISHSLGAYIWPVGQVVKSSPFHGGVTSSTLVQATKTMLLSSLEIVLSVKELTLSWRKTNKMPRIRTGEEAVLKIVELNGFQSSNLWRGAKQMAS